MDSRTAFCNYSTHLCVYLSIEGKVGLELICKTVAYKINLFLTVESKLEITGVGKVFQFFQKIKERAVDLTGVRMLTHISGHRIPHNFYRLL